MRLIGITGGIGSGKSHLSSFIQDLGFPVYNSDQRAKNIVNHEKVKAQIISIFGEKAYIQNKYNTKFIASEVFNNDDLLNQLNKIIHPEVQKDFHIFVERRANEGARLVFKESALLVETKAFRRLDKLILVTAPKEVRLNRVLKRKGMSKAKFEAIFARQAKDNLKRQFADIIIENNEANPFLPKLMKFLNELNTN